MTRLIPVFAVFTLLFAPGCEALFGDAQQQVVTTSDAGTCQRDLDALNALLRRADPQICRLGTDCPAGSFCSSKTSTCDWECTANSDCALGETCSCAGQCQGTSGPLPPAGDPTCPRNLDLLRASTARSCHLDEECPYGGHCDPGTLKCSYQCLGITGESICDAAQSQACDCFGRCSILGATQRNIKNDLPALSVSPSSVVFSGTPTTVPWTNRAVDVTITSYRDPGVATSAGPAVTVAAGPGVALACTSLAQPTDTCRLAGWALTDSDPTDQNNVWKATQRVSAFPKRLGNVLANGSFENSTTGWTSLGKTGGGSAWVSEALSVQDGLSSIRLTSVSATATHDTLSTSPALPLPGDYLLGLWMRTEGLAIKPRVSVSVDAGLVSESKVVLEGPLGTTAWASYRPGGVTIAQASRTVLVTAELPPGTTGSVWLDKIELLPATKQLDGTWINRASTLTPPPWTLQITAAGVVDGEHTVTFEYAKSGEVSQVPAPAPAPLPMDGEYTGYATADLPLGGTLAGSATKGGVHSLRIPVRVWARPDRGILYLHDETRTLSSSGAVPLDSSLSWAKPALNGVSGDYRVRVLNKPTGSQAVPWTFDPRSGRLSGSFVVEMPLPIGATSSNQEWKYELNRQQDLQSCTSCAAGYICASSIGICVSAATSPEDGVDTTASAPQNSLLHAERQGWQSKVRDFWAKAVAVDRSSSLASVPDIYDAKNGLLNPNLPSVVHGSETIFSGKNDLCARDFSAFLTWAQGLGQGNAVLQNYNGAEKTYSPWTLVCSILYHVPSCDVRFDPPSCFGKAIAANTAVAEAVPCLDAPASHWLFAQQRTKTIRCQDLHVNSQLVNPENGTYEGYLRSCLASGVYGQADGLSYPEYLVFDSRPSEQYGIYLCPFRKAMYARGNGRYQAEAHLCVDEALYPPKLISSTTIQHNPETVLSLSGDLTCADSSIPGGADALRYRDGQAASPYVSAAPKGPAMASTCLSDLALVPPSLDGASSSTIRSLHKSVFTGVCFSPGHFYPALELLSGRLEQSLGRVPTTEGQKLFGRQIADWAKLHGFLLRQGRQELELADVLGSAHAPRSEDLLATKTSADLGQLLDAAEKSWVLLLDRAQSDVLLTLPAAVLASPDYRTSVDSSKDHDQGVGVSAFLLETLTAELSLLELYANRESGNVYAQCYAGGTSSTRTEVLARIGKVMRYTLAVQALADRLASTAGTSAWTSRYLDSREELAAARSRLLDLVSDLVQCKNPLGISEDDLPLFFGDPVGDSSRFFASSDYLLGTWAIPSVLSAQNALSTARDAWLRRRDGEIQQRITDIEAERRKETLEGQHGGVVVAACGLTGIESKDGLRALAPGNGLTAANCFVHTEKPECRASLETMTKKTVTTEVARYNLCVLDSLKDLLTLEPSLKTLAARRQEVTIQNNKFYLAGTPVESVAPSILFRTWFLALPAQRVEDAKSSCDAEMGGRFELDSPENFNPKLAQATCYRGTLGESFMSILRAEREMQTALQNWKDSQERYAKKTEYCLEAKGLIDQNSELHSLHRQTMDKLARERTQAEQDERTYRFGAGALAIMVDPSAALLVGKDIADAAFETFHTALATTPKEITEEMEKAERAFRENIALNENAQKILACTAEADQYWIGIRTALLGYQSQLVAHQASILAFLNLQTAVQRALLEGQATVAREDGRRITDLGHHHWLDEKIDRFRKELAWSKRLTYLAMSAVEFEFQQSLNLRGQILAATHPDQLEDSIRELQQEQAGRTINRRRPEESSIVLSLRNDILKLGDLTDVAAGERNWTSAIRFQRRLWSPEYAIFDENHQYLGQGIRFRVDESGPLYHRCAERLWRVGATLQGDVAGATAPTVPVFLLKQNTFYSQWCDDHGGGGTYQSASVRPSVQLFRPGTGAAVEGETNGFVASVLYPWFNVRRSDFYKAQYQEGASEELAGRGLYGEYVLLFPMHGLLESSPDYPNGFPLEQLEDVLLRFDYLSIDNVPRF